MSKIDIAHLHCHTCYSKADGMPQLRDYVNAVYKQNKDPTSKYNVLGFSANDHGVVHAIADQYMACCEPDVADHATKAIYGMEIYHCVDVNNNPNKVRFHLNLLAMTNEGLTNLYQIASHAGMNLIEGQLKDFPVTDINFLRSHGKGIIATTACIGGYVPQLILSGDLANAESVILDFASIFEELYLEVQPLDMTNQIIVNKALVDFSAKLNIPLVITSDSHYINANDQKYHNILKEISHQKPFTELAHLRTGEELEMYCTAHSIPLSALYNTGEIAKKCNANPKPVDNRYILPVFLVPQGYTEETYLRELSFTELKKRIIRNKIDDPVKYIKKMLYELDIICNAGYAGYFLILWDWFEWCRQNDILTGPGRGSAAASIVSYVLNITKVDPIKNNFVFERFLNPGRLSFPDIDTDIPRSKRGMAIAYLQQRYGVDNVSQIITFGKYKLKNTTKAIMSSLGCDFMEANAITKEIPDMIDGKEVNWDLIEGVATDPNHEKYNDFTDGEKRQLSNLYDKFQELFRKYPVLYDGIKSLSGTIASTGIHAGGVIICKEPIKNHMGILAPTGSAVLPIVQCSMNALEFFGFLKVDALGLGTLDVIKETMDLAGLDYDWYDSEDFSDASVYEMLRNGETTDVFQMAGYMATKMIYDFKVEDIEGLTAVNAGNRPGPLEKDPVTGKSMVDLYIERRQSGVIPSIDPRIDPLLKTTFGCIWYQEDCINLGKVMAGYDAGGADTRIRSVLGKKKIAMIPEIRNEFVYGKATEYNDKHQIVGVSTNDSKWCTGAIAHEFSEDVSNTVFDSMESFAKYSFNKSHAFCYAVVAYKTAWLSKHYPVEFAIANCTVNEKKEKIIATLSLAKKRQIPILPPDINKSKVGFSYEIAGVKEAIRYGLKAISGVGPRVLNFIEDYKKLAKVTFKDFDDYYQQMHSNNEVILSMISRIRLETGKNSSNPLNKGIEEALIIAGAFDFCNENRHDLLNHYMLDIRKEKNYTRKDPKAYDRKAKLAYEMEYMGAYISEHPLDPFSYEDFESAEEGQMIKTTLIVSAATIKQTKTKKNFLSIKGVDKTDKEITVNVFNEDLANSLKIDVKKNSIVIVEGNASKKFNNINARKVRIAIRQAIQTEDMVVEESVPVQQPLVPTSESFDPIKDIFGL